MDKLAPRPAGTWALEPGASIQLVPGRCGHLQARESRLWANGQLLAPGEKLRIWSGERVQLRSFPGSRPAFFSWDHCQVRPRSDRGPLRLVARLLAWLDGTLAGPRPFRRGASAACR
jgi:hypothetical protein